jgi:hypothetical protein
MAYTADSLSNIATTSGNNLWFYKTDDAMTVVRAPDYFLNAIDMIRLHDVIIVMADVDGTPDLKITYCNSNNGTAIDVTDGLTITATDTDA